MHLPSHMKPGFYLDVEPCEFLKRIPAQSAEVTRSFDRMPVDPWYNITGATRTRRFQRFHKVDSGWEYSSDYSFLQSKSYNSLVGDVTRTFEPIELAVRETAILEQLALHQAKVFGLDIDSYVVGVHQFRVAVTDEFEGTSTPEGIHQDGHDFVCIVHWNSRNITGAVSRIYDLNKQLIHQHPLREMGESLCLNDRSNFHDVSTIRCDDKRNVGVRDVFVFDWDLKEE